MIQLSVILHTVGWGEPLRANLEALANQTLDPHDFEVILNAHNAEGEQAGGLEARLAQMALPYACKVVRLAGSYSSETLNRSVEAATGHFCLFLKEAQIASPGLLAEHLQVQLETGGCLGIGRVAFIPGPGSSWYAIQACGWQNQQADARIKGERRLTWIDCLNLNFSASRQAILTAPPQSPHSKGEWGEGEAEMELAFRLARGGLRCVAIPGAVCTIEEHRGWTALAKETVQRGAAYVNLWHQHPAMLPELLGNFYDSSLRGILLRRFLLWLTLSPVLFGWIGSLRRDQDWASEWFKFFQSYCFWYGVKQALPDRPTWRRLIHGTPILLYHAYGNVGEPTSRYILPPRRFAQQMGLLKLLGYQTLSLEEYLEHLVTYRLVPERSLVITIDDGYLDNYQLAVPVLRRFGFKATIFIVNDYLGDSNIWEEGSSLTGRPLLSGPQARELLQAGISLGSHTCRHPTLTEIAPEQSWEEISRSKAELERELGAPVQTFAYPHGEFNASTLDQVKRAGYLGACSVLRGLNTPAAPQFTLYRTEIYGTTSLLQFLVSVWSG